jgi:ATP phosphoribosyltransferase regulatory subunit
VPRIRTYATAAGAEAARSGAHREAVAFYELALGHLGDDWATRAGLLEALSQRDLVGVETQVQQLGLDGASHDLLVKLPTLRGGLEVLDRVNGPVAAAVDGLRELYELLAERGVADRVIFDLGLVRELGYYTGVVFEVNDPAVGFAIGGGGRYDDLLGRFGPARPACGVALDIHRVHVAQLEEERQAAAGEGSA